MATRDPKVRPGKGKKPLPRDKRAMGEIPTNEVDLPEKFDDAKKHQFLQMVRENATYGIEAWKDVYAEAEYDLLFLKGGKNQWPDKERQERERENRLMLTFNDLGQYVDQVANDGRQNRPSINVIPGDGPGATSTFESVKGKPYDIAEVYDGLIRNIEGQSQADSHYDTASQHAIEAGFGWLRVVTDYASPTSFDLDARIKSVRNRFCVILDPDFQEPDASDAGWGFVFDQMTRSSFDLLYPDAQVGSLQDFGPEWGGKEFVAVAEYFERYAVRRKLLLLSSGETVWHDEVKDVLDELAAKDVIVQRERDVDTYCIRWFKLTANDILRGPVKMPCSTVPIVPVFGKELNINGITDYRGLIRNARDPKRAENYWLTAATERVALAPNAPWVGTPKMFEGRTEMWRKANTGTPAFLVANMDGGMLPQRQDPATMPAAELQMAATMTDKVKSTIGMYNASVGASGPETSGRALLALQKEGDIGAYTYADNLSRAVRRVGMILTEMIPALYDGNRLVRIKHKDDTSDSVELNKTIVDEQTGETIIVHDLALGSFDVLVKTGPSYSTLRQEAAEALMEFMRVAPSIGAIIVDKVANVMDWPGADEIRKRVLFTIPKHMLTDEEREEVGDVQIEPTPEQQAEMAKAEATMATAAATKAQAEAKSMEAQAKIAEIQAGAANNPEMDQIRKLIEETVAEVLAGAARAQAAPTPTP